MNLLTVNKHRGVAQLVEWRSPKPWAAGSSPVSPARKPRLLSLGFFNEKLIADILLTNSYCPILILSGNWLPVLGTASDAVLPACTAVSDISSSKFGPV